MSELPISTALPDLCRALCDHHQAVLVAPPGAGKTTQVPLTLLAQPWLKGKILMFEPRRMAARAAAARMAQMRGEPVGRSVGYRIRGEARIGPDTRIEVVTGGVLVRMLIEDPGLHDYAVVILDEFHERNLDADMALALTLAGRALFREQWPLKLLVMSATLDARSVAELLGDAPTITCEGRTYPVSIRHLDTTPLPALVPSVARVLKEVIQGPPGDVLVFLPGQREIMALQKHLQDARQTQVCVLPLYGALTIDQQQRVLAPLQGADVGRRKVVLATDIAETSLTIEGIVHVIDGGFHRTPVFDAKSGMSRLATRRISRASATQRTGRAGRTASGYCYRLWAAEHTLEPFDAPEILQADLTGLALSLKAFGIDDPGELQWLTPPPKKNVQGAMTLLTRLGALDSGRLSAHGRQLAQLPVHPRLGHMLLRAATWGETERACALAALLHENHRGPHPDLDQTLREHGAWPVAVQKTRQQFKTLIESLSIRPLDPPAVDTALLLAVAFPDRIARKVDGDHNLYQLASGRQAKIPATSTLTSHAWLAVAELGGSEGNREDVIFSASGLDPQVFRGPLRGLVEIERVLSWSERDDRFIAEQIERVGVLELRRKPMPGIDKHDRARAVGAYIGANFHVLPWQDAALQWLARIHLARAHLPELELPDCSDEALKGSIPQWLTPFLMDVTTLADIKKLDLVQLLRNRLDWQQTARLDEHLPAVWVVPSGSTIAIDYRPTPPVLAVKLQEMFGQKETPRVANGRVPLTIHLLSPAGRPLQITQDLAGFWQNGYQQVQKEMKGRYPKHPWPDDPLNAVPTRKTKAALARQKS